MIVTLERAYGQPTGIIMMKEVDTEEEAFTEMRRFLLINNITSNTTSVYIIEEHEEFGELIPKHKKIYMCYHGPEELSLKVFGDPCFGVYDSSYKSKCREFKAEYDDGNKWYVPLMNYLKTVHRAIEVSNGTYYY